MRLAPTALCMAFLFGTGTGLAACAQVVHAPIVQQAAVPSPQSVLTNQDIIKLSQIGLGPDVIITKINTAQQVAFKLETDDLIALKNAGVNQDVISAMMKRASPSDIKSATGSSVSEAASSGVDDPDIHKLAAEQCVSNFTASGSVLTGKTYKDFAELPKASVQRALAKVAQEVAGQGWEKINVSKEAGLITAVQTVLVGSATQEAPLNILVKDGGGNGVRIEITFSGFVSGSIRSSTLRDSFCKIIEAALK